MSNIRKYYLSSILEQGMLTFASGAILQTTLLEMGLTPEMTNQFTAIQTGIQASTILLFSLWADRIKNIVKGYGTNFLLFLPLLLFLFASCYMSVSVNLFLTLLYIVAIIYNIGYGISSILSIKLPYQIMHMGDFNKVSATSGVYTGISALALSFLLTWLQERYEFVRLMRFAFLVAIVTTILRIFLVLSMKRICHREQVKTETRKFHFLKYKPFAFFILPNLIRGLCAGAIGMAVSIGYYTGHLDSRSATLLAVITSLVTILGCGVYALIAGKIAERTILILSSIGVFLFMPMITWFPSTEAFLVFYGFAWFMVVFINYAVPVAVTKIADYETMGRYSAGRMLLHNGGTMLAGFLCIPLFQLIGIQITMVLFAGMQCISGICYYIYMKKNNIR